MIAMQLLALAIVGLVGIIVNWLLMLAIQRKTYHYQPFDRTPSPVTNMTLLRPNISPSTQMSRPPLLPSVRSSTSTFDKFILALLLNDIFVCNFFVPLRLIDLSYGLPCVFLCFILKSIEKLTAIIELIIITLLILTSLIFFCQKRPTSTKFHVLCLLAMTPLFVLYSITTLPYININEQQDEYQSNCIQTFVYIYEGTQITLNWLCCLITYAVIGIDILLLIKMKWAIQRYTRSHLKHLTAAVSQVLTQQEQSVVEQACGKTSIDHGRFRSVYYPSTHQQSVSTSPVDAPNGTPPVQRTTQPLDYLSYLAVNENSHTLVSSTYLLLIIYLIVHIPYWIHELFNLYWSNRLKDIYLLGHILKPLCYMLTNRKYRHHVWAIIRCKTFRTRPNLLRRKSRLLTLNNNNTSLPFY